MKRLLTAAVGTPVMLAAVFLLSGPWFFLFVTFFIEWAALEYLPIVRQRVPPAPLRPLLVPVPLPAAGLATATGGGPQGSAAPIYLLGAVAILTVGVGSLVLLGGAQAEEMLASLGALGFGIPYFALPIASIYYLQHADPWLLFLLLAIVWLGDTGAFYVGSRFGRHKVAPRISPQKSWEGAIAGFLTSIAAAAVWSVWRLERLVPGVLALAAVTAAAAQLGDLVESLIKRGAGVKDSGNVLPGHGGVLDRCDALLFAAPVMLLSFWCLRLSGVEMVKGAAALP